MKEKIFESGAITSALVTVFCWQLPLVLASSGLVSITAAVWMAQYRWVFMVATFVFLGLAFHTTYKNRKKTGPWGMRMLCGTTAVCGLLVVYSLIFR